MYEGTVYIAVSEGEFEYPYARDSIHAIERRDGDSLITFARATKGYESRQKHITNFLDSEHDFILFLDGDQFFPRHTLERLRSHGAPFVSGFYPRRRFDFVAPVWYEPYNGQLPLRPWSAELEADTVYEIGASGWGCVLVHKDVVLAVRSLLKGEWEVLEDDMDILPYDLPRIMKALRGLRSLEYIPAWETQRRANEFEEHLSTLEREIVPFTCVKEPTGSDVRFAIFAKMAGFQLYGDTGVDARHFTNYPIGLGDYQRYKAASGNRLAEMAEEAYEEWRKLCEEGRKAVNGE
jgi:hypothetical protein